MKQVADQQEKHGLWRSIPRITRYGTATAGPAASPTLIIDQHGRIVLKQPWGYLKEASKVLGLLAKKGQKRGSSATIAGVYHNIWPPGVAITMTFLYKFGACLVPIFTEVNDVTEYCA